MTKHVQYMTTTNSKGQYISEQLLTISIIKNEKNKLISVSIVYLYLDNEI